MYDIVQQTNELTDPQENAHGSRGRYGIQILERDAPITCQFDYIKTDRQDKLIMLRRSQELKEIVMTINYRGVFAVAVYVGQNGSMVHM